MRLFDCKCKSLNRLGEHIKTNNNKTDKLREQHKQQCRNTVYQAQDATANRYLSGSGWEIMYSCFVMCLFILCVRLVCVCFVFVCCYMCLFDCKCKNLNRLGEHIQHINEAEKLREKHNNKHRHTGYPAHEPPRINI